MIEQPKKSGKGCLFYGGIVAGVMLLVLVLACFLGYRYAKSLVADFTDAGPVSLPTVQMSDEALRELRERIGKFTRAVDEGKATEPLTVTADEVNALIATQPEVQKLKGHIYVTLATNQVKAQVSVPAEALGLRPLRGRYINGTGTFKVLLQDGQLQVSLDALSAKGKPLPETVMRHIRPQNFAAEFNTDPKYSPALGKIQEVQIKDGQVTIVPRVSQ